MQKNTSRANGTGLRALRALCAALFGAWLLTGCVTIHFEAQVTVSPEGAMHRLTRYSADHDRDSIESRYSLLPGGLWESKEGKWKKRLPDGKTQEGTWQRSIYLLERDYAAGEAIPADYHLTVGYFQPSRNEVRLQSREFGLFTLHSYQESFRDSSKERALPVLRLWHDLNTALLFEVLAHQFGGAPSDSLVAAMLGCADEAWMDAVALINRAYVRGLLDIGVDDTLDDEFRRSIWRIDPDDQPGWTAECLPGAIGREVPFSEPAIRATLASAFDKVEQKLDAIEDELEMVICASVYGSHSVSYATFKMQIELSMPGTVLDHNGRLESEGVLRWDFDPGSFTWVPYEVRARSIAFHPVRIAVFCGAVLLVAMLWYRRRQKSSSAARRSATG